MSNKFWLHLLKLLLLPSYIIRYDLSDSTKYIMHTYRFTYTGSSRNPEASLFVDFKQTQSYL